MTDALTPAGDPSAHDGTPLRPLLLAFGLDVLLAVLLSFSAMVAGVFAWGAWQGIRMAAAGQAPDAAALQAAGTPPVVFLIILTLVSMGGTALLLYFWRRRASSAERAVSLSAAGRGRTWWLAALAGVGAFLLSTLVGAMARALDFDLAPSNLDMIEAGFARYPLFLGLFAVLLAPLYEELLFRRVLFGRLWRAGWPWLGVLLSSLVFALLHELPGFNGKPMLGTLLLLLTYAGMGALFALVYRATGTLWAPIAAHILNNALALAVLQVYGGAHG